MMKLGIIVPVYHEEKNLPFLIEEITKKIQTPHQIYLVFDVEDDPSLPIAGKLQESNSTIKIFMNKYGRSAASAIRTGIEESNEEAVLITMADLSDELHLVDQMVAYVKEGYDVVAGSRHMSGGRYEGRSGLKEHLSALAGKTLHHLCRLPIHDPTNNFKVFSRRLLSHVTIESSRGFEVALEITVKAHLMQCKMAEIPTVWRERKRGQSRFVLSKQIPHYIRWYFLAWKGLFH